MVPELVASRTARPGDPHNCLRPLPLVHSPTSEHRGRQHLLLRPLVLAPLLLLFLLLLLLLSLLLLAARLLGTRSLRARLMQQGGQPGARAAAARARQPAGPAQMGSGGTHIGASFKKGALLWGHGHGCCCTGTSQLAPCQRKQVDGGLRGRERTACSQPARQRPHTPLAPHPPTPPPRGAPVHRRAPPKHALLLRRPLLAAAVPLLPRRPALAFVRQGRGAGDEARRWRQRLAPAAAGRRGHQLARQLHRGRVHAAGGSEHVSGSKDCGRGVGGTAQRQQTRRGVQGPWSSG